MIGYDTVDTEVTDLAVKGDSSEILMIIRTTEPNINGGLANTAQIASYKPATDSYNWLRVYENTKLRSTFNSDYILYSDNENMALFSYCDSSDFQNFLWIDPTAVGQGAPSNTVTYKLDQSLGEFRKHSLVVTSDMTTPYIFFFMWYDTTSGDYRLIR